MARILGYIAASLDGFIATSEDSLDWLFKYEGIELATAAIGEIPGVRDIQIVRHSSSEAEVSFLVAADRLASVVEDRLSHFGLTWVSLQLLEVLESPDPDVAGGR